MLHAELLTPLDIEREFRMTGGHWHHGEITLDQYLMLRPACRARLSTPRPIPRSLSLRRRLSSRRRRDGQRGVQRGERAFCGRSGDS